MSVLLFKVMRQQVISESGKFNYILWADNFCLQQWKNYCRKIGRYLQFCSNEKSSFFLTVQ